jgi:4-hydroxyphenylacetate 3-monooxygenase
VFCHDNVEMTRAIYMRTPGHAMANHQANVRFLAKLNLIVGVASKLAEMNNVQHIPAVQFTLGRLAAMQATLEGLIMGQINCGEAQIAGYHTVNRRYVYAALHWCTNHHAEICDTVRELMGAGVSRCRPTCRSWTTGARGTRSRPTGRCPVNRRKTA